MSESTAYVVVELMLLAVQAAVVWEVFRGPI